MAYALAGLDHFIIQVSRLSDLNNKAKLLETLDALKQRSPIEIGV